MMAQTAISRRDAWYTRVSAASAASAISGVFSG